ncbi:ISL3 family transposase [Candidatus Uabimicrobium sp. HlEnr_7]|uniref:ISL3 family transposase n=1 Tax=Candidatus Uabimicrobium helgolandensis TaxID=3095367 RepID=UPI0035573510
MFTEPGTNTRLKSYARTTCRLSMSLTALVFSTTAKGSERLSAKLALPKSRNTFLRIVRKTPTQVADKVRVVAIDDWAFRKGNNYGTIVCNHETHQVIDIFPERTSEALEKWLKQYPSIVIATRDRSNSYRQALSEANSKIIQIADRFHLVQNLLDSLGDFVKRIFKTKVPVGFEKPAKPQSKEMVKKREISDEKHLSARQIEERFKIREEKRQLVRKAKKLHLEKCPIMVIANQLGIGWATAKRYIELDEEVAIVRRKSRWKSISYHQYEKNIYELLKKGKNSIEILSVLRRRGFKGGKSTLRRWIAEIKNNKNIDEPSKRRHIEPSEKIIWMPHDKFIKCLWTYSDKLCQEDKKVRDDIFQRLPVIKVMYQLILEFRNMIRDKDHSSLNPWLSKALESNITEIIRFATGIKENLTEVENAFLYPYSNGLAEGHINKLKLIKRMMFGRAKFDLLRKRVLYQQE